MSSETGETGKAGVIISPADENPMDKFVSRAFNLVARPLC